MAGIYLENLAHSYSKHPQGDHDYAIKALSHQFEQGGAYALLGPSGCGKSTLLNIISGLLQPTEGQVKFDDKIVTHQSPQQRNIAQVFQFPVVYDAMTVAENLAFPLKNIGLDKQRIAAKVIEIAELLELDSVLNQKANHLSADQKQKISMARGLVREDVSAILFDEPLTVIDPQLKWKLRRKLKQIHQQFNITMLYVTHDQLEAATFADKIAVMYDGRIVQFGTPQELFESPNHRFVGYFIGSPGMNFITVTRDHEECVSAYNHKFSLTLTQQAALKGYQGEDIQIGIRPEYIQLTDNPEALPGNTVIPATLVDIEHLGSYQLVHVEVNDTRWVVRCGADQPINADKLWLSLPAKRLKLYLDEYLAGEHG